MQTFSKTIGVEQLTGLTAELAVLRSHPPLTRRSDGKYEGDILGFVKGLRFAARTIYFLRERLSPYPNVEVSWGHIIQEDGRSCSPECDVIVHEKGHVRQWNGNSHSIMDFKFIYPGTVHAVVSCKSLISAIDKEYPKVLKTFGIDSVFLFAECCKEADSKRLQKSARKCGYTGLWWLYLTDNPDSPDIIQDQTMHVAFGDAVAAAIREMPVRKRKSKGGKPRKS